MAGRGVRDPPAGSGCAGWCWLRRRACRRRCARARTFEIAPQDLPAYLAHDPSVALRYFPKAPDPAFDARLGREVTGLAKLIRSNRRAIRSSRTGCTASAIPTLVLWGGADRLRPTAQADAWMQLLPTHA